MTDPTPGAPGPQWPPSGPAPQGPYPQGPPPQWAPAGPPPQWAPPTGPPSQWAPAGQGWGPPPPGSPGGPGGPGGPPAGGSRRTGLVLGLVGGVVVLVLVAVAAVVLLGGDDEDQVLDFGGGPRDEPEEEWAVDVETSEDPDLLSDGERAFIVREEEDDEGDDIEFRTIVTAYAAADGEELWDHEIEDGAGSDPVRPLGDDQVLVSGYDEDTTALLDAATGDVLWEADGEPVDTELSLGLGLPFGRNAPPDVVLLAVSDEDGDDDRVSVIDRDSGEELWDEVGDDALLCDDTVVTIVVREPFGEDEEDLMGGPAADITGRDVATGEERWSRDGYPGLCDAEEVAIGTDDEVTLVDVATGEEGATFDAPGGGSVYSIPSGDHLVVTSVDITAEEGSVSAAVYPRDGGAATYEADDSIAIPIADDLVITAAEDAEEVALVRASDGEEVGSVEVPDDEEGSCAGTLTLTTALFCETGSPEVTAHAVAEGFEERWSVDVGAGVREATLGGERLFAVTEDDELVALR